MSANTERKSETTDWPAAWANLATLDDDAWDVEDARLSERWKAEYTAAFVSHALTRPGWDRENAEAWCGSIVDDAFIACSGQDVTPQHAAETDVSECEREAANA